jgi:hypothetical protein
MEAAMSDDADGEEDDTEVTIYVPIGERCYSGCRRRAVVNDGGMYCAKCWMGRHRHK